MATETTSPVGDAPSLEDLSGIEPACEEVEACALRLLADGFGRVPVRELVSSLEFSRSLANAGGRPQRAALLRITALSLILLARMPAPVPAAPAGQRAHSALRLQAPARAPDGVDLDGNPVEPIDD